MKPLPRYLIACAAGGIVTFVLFALMIGLIKISEQPVASGDFEMVDFIRVEHDRSLNLEQMKPLPPPQPQAPPERVSMQIGGVDVTAQRVAPGGTGPITEGLALSGGIAAGSGGFGSGEGSGSGFGTGFGDGAVGGGDYLPVVQVPPQYPPAALKQGIEGWVLVEFTIGTEGQVKDARVVKSEPAGIFDRPALDAVQRFRFRPRTMGPLAVEVTGVQNRIRFRLEKP